MDQGEEAPWSMSPQAPKRPCPGQGVRRGICTALISRGQRYCPSCLKQANQQDKRYDQGRDQDQSRRWHHSRWMRKATKMFLAANPLCIACSMKGRTTPATDVDHIVPHRGSWDIFIDQDNWQPLCHSCHSKKTAKEDGRWKTKPAVGEGRSHLPAVPL